MIIRRASFRCSLCASGDVDLADGLFARAYALRAPQSRAGLAHDAIAQAERPTLRLGRAASGSVLIVFIVSSAEHRRRKNILATTPNAVRDLSSFRRRFVATDALAMLSIIITRRLVRSGCSTTLIAKSFSSMCSTLVDEQQWDG